MIRRISVLAALCATMTMVAGCDALGRLLNSPEVRNALREAGVSLSFVDPNTGKEGVIKKEDISKVTTKDGKELKEGDDYAFDSTGNIVFKKLDGPRDFVVTRKDGTPLNIKVDPSKGDPSKGPQKIGFISNNGAVVEVPEGRPPEDFFKEQHAIDVEHRVTFHFPTSYGIKADNVLGIGHRVPAPPGSPKSFVTIRIPDQAWKALDNAIEMDVQALGPRNPPEGMQPEDLKKRLWVLGYKKNPPKVTILRFKVDQDLERAEQAKPGQDPRTIKLPDKQEVAEGRLKSFETTEWADDAVAMKEENVQDPQLAEPGKAGAPQPPPPLPDGQQPPK